MVRTVWGDRLVVEPGRFIGGRVYLRGVHELPVCEALWRLSGPGETAVDVGANIGVMTSLLSKRVDSAGRVFSFEPHPQLFRRLELNVSHWGPRRIELFERAVTCRPGVVRLQEGRVFHQNEGTAHLTENKGKGAAFSVTAVQLNEILRDTACGVVKIDVEGHEFEVLSGADELLELRRFRDIVFESAWDYPQPAHDLLAAYGYHVFDLGSSLRGPALNPVARRLDRTGRLSDYVATVDPERALRLIHPSGWRVLRWY